MFVGMTRGSGRWGDGGVKGHKMLFYFYCYFWRERFCVRGFGKKTLAKGLRILEFLKTLHVRKCGKEHG